MAATKWALEFEMDWTCVPILLRAIVDSAGGIGKSADEKVVIAASGFDEREVEKLLNELAILDLAAGCLNEYEDGRVIPGAYINARGWEYLTTGKFTSQLKELEDWLSS